MRIPGSDESTDVFVEIIPYFAKCGYDCPRPTENLKNCVQRKANEILTINSVGRFVCFLLAAILVTLRIPVRWLVSSQTEEFLTLFLKGMPPSPPQKNQSQQ